MILRSYKLIRLGGPLAVAALALGCGDDGDETTSAGPGVGPGPTMPTTNSTGPTGSATDTDTAGTASSSSATLPTTTNTATDTDPTTAGTDPTTAGTDPTVGTTGEPMLDCSADLHSIVNENDQIVEECAPDEGCLNAECVPACEAAGQSEANFGCSFMASTPPAYPPALPPCFAAFVTNSWGHPALIDVSRDGVDFDVTTFGRLVTPGLEPVDWPPIPDTGIPEGGAAVLFLSSDPNAIMPENQVDLSCPVTPAVDAATMITGTGRGQAFEITSDIPVTTYDIMPFGGARSHFPSAELMFPTHVWGTNYMSMMSPIGTHNNPGPMWMQIVGLEDNTLLELAATAQLQAGGDLEGAPQGVLTGFSLDRGEVLQWHVANNAEATGTLFQSDKPVALFTGNRFMRLQPNPAPGGDSTHQQISAISALGFDYIASPYETRRADLMPEAVDYRIVGVVDGTTLTYDPPINGAPLALDAGQVIDFATTLPFQITSQGDTHPFLFSQIMETANLPGGTREGATAQGYPPALGDEEWVIVLPHGQFMDEYVFFTDPTYATTNLVFTRVDAGDGFQDVTVDCLGVIDNWQPVGDTGIYEVATADLMRADVGVNGCENGLHVAESEGPFGLTVWGLDSYSSYAYPAGGNAFALTDVVVPLE